MDDSVVTLRLRSNEKTVGASVHWWTSQIGRKGETAHYPKESDVGINEIDVTLAMESNKEKQHHLRVQS